MKTKYLGGTLFYICRCGLMFSNKEKLEKHWADRECHFWE